MIAGAELRQLELANLTDAAHAAIVDAAERELTPELGPCELHPLGLVAFRNRVRVELDCFRRELEQVLR